MSPQILVVDDEQQILKLFAMLLEKGGYRIIRAPSGQLARDAIRGNDAIDAVVLDLSMPEPDGFELLKELRQTRPEVPVIVVSGFMQGSLLKAAELMGASATVAKTD